MATHVYNYSLPSLIKIKRSPVEYLVLKMAEDLATWWQMWEQTQLRSRTEKVHPATHGLKWKINYVEKSENEEKYLATWCQTWE